MKINNADKEYTSLEEISIESDIHHSLDSRAEAHDRTVLKIILPSWLEYKAGSCKTNYTSDRNCVIDPSVRNDSKSFDIIFENGIYYSSFIELKFSLVVGKVVPSGKNMLNSAITSFTECMQSMFTTFPSSNTTKVRCSAVSSVNIKVTSPACTATISIPSCAVSASSAFDTDTLPENIVNDDSKVWSPAVRSTTNGEYVILSHDEVLIITSVDIKLSEAGNSLPTKVFVEASKSGYTWKRIAEVDVITASLSITFKKKEKGKKIKVSFVSAGSKIGISFISLKGCPPVLITSTCPINPPPIPVSSNANSYRHLALDDMKLILYFCDMNPMIGRLSCYSLKQGESKFNYLPSYVAGITGFSPTTKKMYLKERY